MLIVDSNSTICVLCLDGCTHEMSYLGWVDDNYCRVFVGMIVVGVMH